MLSMLSNFVNQRMLRSYTCSAGDIYPAIYIYRTVSKNAMYYKRTRTYAERNDMRVQHRRVERRDEQIEIRYHESHCAVDDAVIAIDETLWLVSETAVCSSQGERAIGQVQLLRPSDPGGSTHGGGGGDVGVIWTNCFSWGICCRLVMVHIHRQLVEVSHTPLKQNLLAGEGERLGLVVGDLRIATISGSIGVEAALGDVGD